MATDAPSTPELTLPALLRGARNAYAVAIRSALAEAAYDDVPASGAFVISALARTGAPLSDIVSRLGTSKQAGGQLVDALVGRGYLERTVDPGDRRRLNVALTARGEAAAAVVRGAVAAVDAGLEARVGAAAIAQTRATLMALMEGLDA